MRELTAAAAEIEEEEDGAIVNRCRDGDREAFAVLVRRHQKKMLNIAYRMLGNYDEACDAVQEAFISAFKSIGRFRGDSQFSTWLCGILLNHARNHLAGRTAQSRRVVSLDDPSFIADGFAQRSSTSTEAENSLEDNLDKIALQRKVQSCIGRLDGDHREVIVLRDIQGFSYEEISRALKIPDGTVRSRLFRARHELKSHLVKVLGDFL